MTDLIGRYIGKQARAISALADRYAVRASPIPDNLSERMDKALDVMQKDQALDRIMRDITHLGAEWARAMNNDDALELEKREQALVKKAEDRENQLGIQRYNGFPYL